MFPEYQIGILEWFQKESGLMAVITEINYILKYI